MAESNRRKPLPETIAGDYGITIDEACSVAEQVDGRQELIDAAAAEHAFQGSVAARFRGLNAGDVLRLWESGRNEQGRKLSRFEVMALGEQWAALTGQPGLPNLGSATAPSPARPATPPAPVPADDTIIGMRDAVRMTGLSKSTIKRRVGAGTFPRWTKLSIRRVGWPASKVKAWLAEQEAASDYMPARGGHGRSRLH
jgi:prophage regulatory protein